MAKRLSVIVVFIIVVASLFATTNVYAFWSYTEPVGESSYLMGSVGMGEFIFTPEEVLPGDKEATSLGENHLNLVNNIVSHVDYGLNATKKPIVRKLLEDGVPVVYCDQNVSGGNLKHMMIGSNDVDSLMFCVEYVTATEYNAYTFSGNLVERPNVGVIIDVYKTVIVKNGTRWTADRSYLGKAEIAVVYASSGEQLLSIDQKTWK